MEQWQKNVLRRAAKSDFVEDKQKILDAFQEICSVFSNNPNIDVKEESLIVNGKEYELQISTNEIQIVEFCNGKSSKEDDFEFTLKSIYKTNENNQYQYIKKGAMPFGYEPWQQVKKTDYVEILNTLMSDMFNEEKKTTSIPIG